MLIFQLILNKFIKKLQKILNNLELLYFILN